MAGSHPTAAGPYAIVRPLGRGRLGDLYLAVDPSVDRYVALRILPDLSAESRDRFARDVRHRAGLHHTAIAPIYAIGEHEGLLYFARAFIAGQTFEQLIHTQALAPVHQRVEWMATICSALAYAYGLGYVDMTLRCAEIVVGGEGTPTMLDVGLPEIVEGTMAGRPEAYRSPEQLRGADRDQRSDIFVAGAVLHELIACEKPFGDGPDTEILARIEAGAHRARSGPMEPALAAVVTKALQADPAARHQTFEELASELRRVGRLLADTDTLESLAAPPQTVIVTAPARRVPASSRPHVDAATLERRREALLEQHLARGREALQRSEYDAAAASAEQAAGLEPDDPRVAELRGLIEAGRRSRDVARLVEDARRSLEDGALDAAAGRIDGVLALAPAHEEARRVRAAIDEQRRQRALRERSDAARQRPAEIVSPPGDVKEGPRIDDNVRFTVYRPAVMVPERWHPLLCFTHLSDRRPDAAPEEMHPVARVEAEAARVLGTAVESFPRIVQEAGAGIPHEALVRLKPSVAGLVFNPPEYSFLWTESVHRAEFKVRAASTLDGRTARGTIEVYVGAIPVALITLAIPIDGRAPAAGATAQDVARPYRRIFASYSHKDTAIVRQFANYARGMGDSYMRDVVDLRAGELWDDRLMTLIDEADVFQLFWSTNSMRSPFVRREWEHALTVDKSNFVRPLYWESPFPEGEGLPPPQLRARHFASVAIAHDASDLDRGATHDTRTIAPAPGSTAGLVVEVASARGWPMPEVTRKVFGEAGGTIGRTGGSDWVLAHKNVSRVHARISCENGVYHVEDTSTNGLFLNAPGKRLERGKRYPLHDGDRLFIDPYELLVSVVSDPDTAAVDGPPTGPLLDSSRDAFLAARPGAAKHRPPAAPEIGLPPEAPSSRPVPTWTDDQDRLRRDAEGHARAAALEEEARRQAEEQKRRAAEHARVAREQRAREQAMKPVEAYADRVAVEPSVLGSPIEPTTRSPRPPVAGIPAARPLGALGSIVAIGLVVLVVLAFALFFLRR